MGITVEKIKAWAQLVAALTALVYAIKASIQADLNKKVLNYMHSPEIVEEVEQGKR